MPVAGVPDPLVGSRPLRLCNRPSEEGLFGGNPVAPGEALRAGLHLAQHPVLESLVGHLGGLEAELTERLGRPPVVRRLPLSSSGRGGSETSSHAPTRSKGAAHSASTAGRPNDRANTPSNPARRLASLPQTSARSSRTETRVSRARRSTAPRRKEARLPLASIRTSVAAGHSVPSRGRGGHRPSPGRRGGPEPPGDRRRPTAANPWACRICGSSGPGPRKPQARASPAARAEGWGRVPLVGAGHRRRVSPRVR